MTGRICWTIWGSAGGIDAQEYRLTKFWMSLTANHVSAKLSDVRRWLCPAVKSLATVRAMPALLTGGGAFQETIRHCHFISGGSAENDSQPRTFAAAFFKASNLS